VSLLHVLVLNGVPPSSGECVGALVNVPHSLLQALKTTPASDLVKEAAVAVTFSERLPSERFRRTQYTQRHLYVLPCILHKESYVSSPSVSPLWNGTSNL
jgi:hypothetical protein